VRFDYPLQNAAKTKQSGLEGVTMLVYSALLTLGLVLSSPWWLLRMATTQRYREGLRQRLGGVPARLSGTARGKRVVWVHAVSVGEVLAASRLVGELEAALGEGFRMVVSTTTRTGQALARERFGTERVFHMPLDFGFAVRAYLRALKPEALILMESELWPRMLHECSRSGVPVAVVNARMSDRSFARAMRMQPVWGRVMRRPTLWLAQSEEDALRLVIVGVRAESVLVAGNLKYDIRTEDENAMRRRISPLLHQTRLLVAGSTLEGEEELLLAAWPTIHKASPDVALMLAPRHPERFESTAELIRKSRYTFSRCSQLLHDSETVFGGTILLLDTIGDLASMYALGAAAFVGGSLVKRGGHNPLEPAQFGVPVVMGPSFENFRDIVAKMQEAGGIRIVQDKDELETALVELLENPEQAKALGERGRRVFEEQQGATERTVEALVAMIQGAKR
jgi:3-deoxy-D-manno-octulosonic-acid transferase